MNLHASRAPARRRSPAVPEPSLCRRASHGVTLPELLVVLGLLVVLCTLLMPTLAGVRRSVQSVRCLNNLRQISQGALTHASSHDGYYPLAGWLAVPNAFPEYLDDTDMVRYTYYRPPNREIQLSSFQGAVANALGHPGGLKAYNFDAQVAAENEPDGFLRLFYCPSHISDPQDATYALVYNANGTAWYLRQSYILNEAFLGWNDTMARRRGYLARMDRQGEVFLAADGLPGSPARPGSLWPYATLFNKVARGPVTLADAFAGNGRAGDPQNFDLKRHRGGINVGFLDGHVESVPMNASNLSRVFILP